MWIMGGGQEIRGQTSISTQHPLLQVYLQKTRSYSCFWVFSQYGRCLSIVPYSEALQISDWTHNMPHLMHCVFQCVDYGLVLWLSYLPKHNYLKLQHYISTYLGSTTWAFFSPHLRRDPLLIFSLFLDYCGLLNVKWSLSRVIQIPPQKTYDFIKP